MNTTRHKTRKTARSKKGKVFLVGAGPGDVGLITVRGAELVDAADVIVLDALVNPALLRSTRARIIYVGKRGPGAPPGEAIRRSQDAINRLLIGLAREGRRVVRLKGGDPLIFGRGGEEMEALRAANVRYEVVPGVTSASAVPAFAGIPLTDRRAASQVTFLTGRERDDGGQATVNWAALSPTQTLVVLMGVAGWRAIAKRLLRQGWSAATPVAAVASGTTPRQRTILSTLGRSADDFGKGRLASPAIIVVGAVARLSRRLAWAAREKPLLGRAVVITRAESDSLRLTRLLHEKGADVLACPTIEVEPIRDDARIGAVVDALRGGGREIDLLLFFSANAVRHFASRFGPDESLPSRVKVGAVGPQTAEAVRRAGWRVSVSASPYSAAGLQRRLGSIKGKRIVVPRAAGAPAEPMDSLRRAGATVNELAVYRNRPASLPRAGLRRAMLHGADAVTFTSASTVRNFVRLFSRPDRERLFARAWAVAIGPSTAAELRRVGVRRILRAKDATVAAMVETMARKIKVF